MIDSVLAALIALGTAAVFVAAGVLYVRRRALSVEDYLVSRNTAGLGLATATLVASGMGAWILFSPAETGTWAGLAGIVGYAIGAAAPFVAFILLGPRMRKLMPEGHSLTEYVWHRFGPVMYVFILCVVVFYMLVFLSAELTGISLAFDLIADTQLGVTALIVGLLTVAYTAYGGMRASLFTDRVQFYVIIPLLFLVLAAAVSALDGLGEAFSAVSKDSPELLSASYRGGIEFGITLIIAVLAANMFHQGYWQRVYAMRDDTTLRRSFLIAGLVSIPLVIVTGIFGILSVGKGASEAHDSVAMFSLIVDAMPAWSAVVVLLLALMLVMSSMDTLLNGIASTITSDLARYRPDLAGGSLLRSSRVITAVLIIPAIVVASQGWSVLYLFLIADLVCAAVLFPVFFGMYTRTFSASDALVSSVAGLVVGALLFPLPDFSAWNSLPLSGSTLYSFGAALGVSTVLSIVLNLVSVNRRAEEYDFSRLAQQVKLIAD